MEPINVCLMKINEQNIECFTYRSNEFEKDLIVCGRFNQDDTVKRYFKVLKILDNSIWFKPMLKYKSENSKVLNIVLSRTHLKTNGVVIKQNKDDIKIKIIKNIVVKNYYLNQSSEDFLNAYDLNSNKIIRVVNIAKHFPIVLSANTEDECENLFATALTPDLTLLHKVDKYGDINIEKLYTSMYLNQLLLSNIILGKFDKTDKIFVANKTDFDCYLVNKKISNKAYKLFINNILYDKYGYCVFKPSKLGYSKINKKL